MTVELRSTVPGTNVERGLDRDDLIVITGAGGFIAGSLARYFHDQGFTRIRAIDRKPLPEWYQRVPGVECLSHGPEPRGERHPRRRGRRRGLQPGRRHGRDGLHRALPRRVPAQHPHQHAHDRGGLPRRRRSATSSPRRPAPTTRTSRSRPTCIALKESDAYPAMAERGYGWEKLISEMFCQEYWAERGLETHIARFHNIYGPNGTWYGGREKAPAAMCRKVIEAKDSGDLRIEIWGDGTQTRSFCTSTTASRASTGSCTATTSSPRRSTSARASWSRSTSWSRSSRRSPA